MSRDISRRTLLGSFVLSVASLTHRANVGINANVAKVAGSTLYVQADSLKRLPFGTNSHYLQPWRSYVQTVQAAQVTGGVGIVLNDQDETPLDTIDRLADHGFTHVRIEVSWNRVRFDDESQISNAERLKRLLTACKNKSIRPLILLNGHHGLPTPALQFDGIVQSDAIAGARSIHLKTTGKIVLGFTGLSDLTTFWAAEVLITGIDGDHLTLSKPLPRIIRQGEKIKLATLKYRPFSQSDSDHGEETLAGWIRYIDVVSRLAVEALGSAESPDKGFDLEIWNELSNGAMFLSINNYYDSPVDQEPAHLTWDRIVKRSSEWVSANPERFKGVRLCNGFASTVPWPASSTQPPAVSAISKHPYPPLVEFPRDNQHNTETLDAWGQPTKWAPTYRAYFPEYYATGIQTETIVRDMGPMICDIYGTKHGRHARADGAGPVSVWITEIGVNPVEAGITDPVAGEMLKAKATARALLFYLNKGSDRIYFYSASSGPGGYGFVDDADVGCSKRQLTLDIVKRITKMMNVVDNVEPREDLALDFVVRTRSTSSLQFVGDGSEANPSFHNVDMLALLPFQAGERRVIIAYYFVTRDLRVVVKPERVEIGMSGLPWKDIAISKYDPFADIWKPVLIKTSPNGVVRISMLVTDSPQFLVVDQGARRKSSAHGQRTDVVLGSDNPLEAVKWN